MHERTDNCDVCSGECESTSVHFVHLIKTYFKCKFQQENDRSGHLAKLYLRETRMQGFMYKAEGKWGEFEVN